MIVTNVVAISISHNLNRPQVLQILKAYKF